MEKEKEFKISSDENYSKTFDSRVVKDSNRSFGSIVVKIHGISLIILSLVLLFSIFLTIWNGYNLEMFMFTPFVVYFFSYGLFYYRRHYKIRFSSILNNISIIFFFLPLLALISLVYGELFITAGGWGRGMLEYAICVIAFPISFLLSTIYIIREGSSKARRFILYGLIFSVVLGGLIFILA